MATTEKRWLTLRWTNNIPSRVGSDTPEKPELSPGRVDRFRLVCEFLKTDFSMQTVNIQIGLGETVYQRTGT